MWCTIPPQWNMKRFDKKATTDLLIKKKAKPFKRFINLTCGTELWHAQEFCAGAPERRVLYVFEMRLWQEVSGRKCADKLECTCSDEYVSLLAPQMFIFYIGSKCKNA